MAALVGHVVMDMLRDEGQLFQKTHLVEKEELQNLTLQKCLAQTVRWLMTSHLLQPMKSYISKGRDLCSTDCIQP